MEERADTLGEGSQHPLVGQVIGERYRIDALLGEGGMGAVFRATHLGLGRPVAVKVLHPRLSDDDHIAKRFDREALAVSKLDHPNCVQVMDFGTTRKGMKYLVMQFLEGKELRDVTGVALPVEQVVYLGIQVLRALEHAHKRGLVHRDLKPENIFLTEDDDGNQVVKLVDFGIVKMLEDAPQEKLTRLGMAFGTPTYMSPEQAAGGKIDGRTDLYSTGVVLYELLTGVPPFDADEPGILMRMHILADPPPLPDTVPKAVAAVVSKLLAKEPADRYADAREARRALSAAYALPSKVTGVVGFAAVARDDATDPPIVMPPIVAPPGAAPPVAAPPVAAPPVVAPALAAAQAPTVAQDLAATRAEPSPSSDAAELFVRSGGTVLAPPSGQAGASTSHGAMPVPIAVPGPGASTSYGAMPVPIAMPGPGPTASMSHGSVPIVPMHAGGPHFDPLAMSSPGLPPLGSGMYVSGPHPHSGVYASLPPPMARRGSGRRTGTIVVVVLLLVTWIAIAAVWSSGQADERPGPSSPAAAPATAPVAAPATSPAAGGLYRFADDQAPTDAPPWSGAAHPSDGKKGKKKKPKHEDDD